MVKVVEGKRKLAKSRRRSEMASKWLKSPPVVRGVQFKERRIADSNEKKRFLGGATTLMYAAQQGDVEKVKKIVKEQVSRPYNIG